MTYFFTHSVHNLYRVGPLSRHWWMRFKAKHAFFKRIAKKAYNFKKKISQYLKRADISRYYMAWMHTEAPLLRNYIHLHNSYRLYIISIVVDIKSASARLHGCQRYVNRSTPIPARPMASRHRPVLLVSQGQPQFSILICGVTGYGKSSLINFIVGQDVCDSRWSRGIWSSRFHIQCTTKRC